MLNHCGIFIDLNYGKSTQSKGVENDFPGILLPLFSTLTVSSGDLETSLQISRQCPASQITIRAQKYRLQLASEGSKQDRKGVCVYVRVLRMSLTHSLGEDFEMKQ